MAKKDIPSNGDVFFDRWNTIGDEAFDILGEGKRVPMSAEVFKHGHLEYQKRTGCLASMAYYARWVNENCPIVEGLFDSF